MTDLLHQVSALFRVLESRPLGESNSDVLARAMGLSRELIDCGEWRIARDVALASRSMTMSESTRFGCDLLEAECLIGMAEFEAAHQLLSRALAELEESGSPGSQDSLNWAKVMLGSALWGMHRLEEAEATLAEAYTTLLRRPDSSALGWCACLIGNLEWTRGAYSSAKQRYLEAIVSAHRSRSVRLEAMAYRNLGIIRRQACRWHEAFEDLSRSRDLWERIGNRAQVSHLERALAILEWKRGNTVAAQTLATSSHAGASSTGSKEAIVHGVQLLAMIALHTGDYDRSLSNLRLAAETWDGTIVSRPSLLTAEYLGDVYLEQGQVDHALDEYEEVWSKAVALIPKGDVVAELRRRRAECHYLLGDFAKAYEEAKIGLDHCRELGDRYEEAATYRLLAVSAAALGRASEAKQWFDQGFAYYDDIETPYEWGKLWLAYGDWLSGPHAGDYGDKRGALEAYQAARDHFERMGAHAKLAEAEARLEKLVPPVSAVAAVDRSSTAKTGPETQAAIELRRPQRRPRGSVELERQSEWAREQFGVITRERAMLRLLEDVAKLARSTTPVLVLGESGTGKELIAHALHQISGRVGTFNPINCSALPREIVESELFGHVAGAFTGASRDKAGLLEVCSGGTVFLDEIAEMAVDLQSRLLRFLETGEVRRVGATRAVSVETRVVAATNRERAALERGEGFRTDLYYRLAHAVIELPPLRRRKEDIELLIDHFLEEIGGEEGKQVTFSREARARLKAYAWPGNVRQLKSLVRRVVILSAANHVVSESELQLDEGRVPTTLLEELEQAERRRIVDAMRAARGSRTEASKALGMPRTTLINKLKRYGLA